MLILQYETQIDEDGGITLPLLPEYGGRKAVVYVDALNDRMLIYDTRIAQDGGITLPLFPQKQNGLPVIVSVEGETKYGIGDGELPATLDSIENSFHSFKHEIVDEIGNIRNDLDIFDIEGRAIYKICEELMWRIERLLDEKIKP
jgi:hypothetical protein